LVVLADRGGGEDIVERGELKEGRFISTKSSSVCCFLGDRDIGTVNNTFSVLGVYYY
jgi:hypothetical protein